MMGIMGTATSSMSAVTVCNLPSSTSEVHLADYFGRFGRIMKDRTSGGPMVRLYRDKITQKLTGDAIVAFENHHAAEAAVEWINNTELNGNIVSVSVSEGAEFLNLVAPPSSIENPTTHVEPGYATDFNFAGDAGGCGVKCEGVFGDARGPVDLDGGKRKGRVDGKPWQQDGDWSCPNSSCVNINFAFRGVCNRCGSARPAVDLASGGGVAGSVRGRIRGANDACGRGRGSGGPPGLFGPNDWSCPMYVKRYICVGI